MEILEQRVRRSSRLKDTSAFRQFLAYACMVSDQDEVYSYMQQNKMGINEPQYWAAKLTMLKNRCEYEKFITVLKQINRNPEMKKHPKYWLIDELAKQLQKNLQRMLRNKARNKRSVREYQVLNFASIEKSTRKFGKIQVYVDPDCRMQYRLEDLVDFVTKRLAKDCEVQRNFYLREISKRPLSFIGKNKEKFRKIPVGILTCQSENERQSNARKTNSRMSIGERQINIIDFQLTKTPDFKKKSISKESRNMEVKKLHHQLDSVQREKNISRKSIINSQKSKKKFQSPNPEFIQSPLSVKKQRIRKSPLKQQVFFEPDSDISTDSIFSFGEQDKIPFPLLNKTHKKSKQKYLKKIQLDELISKQNQNDIAFIQETQPQTLQQDSQGSLLMKNTKQSLELQNVIKQIQMQKYQSQTFSEIDSNKENNMLNGQQDIFNLDNNIFDCIRDRRKFQSLRKDDNYSEKENSRFNQESQIQNQRDQSSRVIYQQFLQYLDVDQKFKLKQCQERLSLSVKDKKKRISRISQERSYSFSQARPTSSRGGSLQ